MKRYGIERRQFMQYMAAVSTIPTLASSVDGYVETNPVFKQNPFTLSVASGDPEPDGVVIWTRLSESPLIGEVTLSSAIEVKWEIAHDEGFKSIANKGTALAVPQLGHSVHVEVQGLEPDRWYFYRFHAGSETSPIGRTRTTPEKHVMPQRMQFAFTSCQHYESGYFNGYPHMQKEDLDLVIHLGDYIYEYAGVDKRVRKHLGKEIESLDEYRRRYAQYRLDEDLQAEPPAEADGGRALPRPVSHAAALVALVIAGRGVAAGRGTAAVSAPMQIWMCLAIVFSSSRTLASCSSYRRTT